MFKDPSALAHALSIPFLIFVIMVAIWRKVSKRPSVQAPLHRVLKKRAFALQWYTVFYVGLILFAALCQLMILKDVVYPGIADRLQGNDPSQREQNLRDVFDKANLNLSEPEYADLSEDEAFKKFKGNLDVGPYFTLINLCGQAAGLIVVFICMAHSFLLLVIPSQRKAIDHEDYQHYSWHTPKRVNWVLWIVSLPAMFSIEVVLANIRVWGIVNGTNPHLRSDYKAGRSLQLLYIKEELQIATLLQFSAVYAFTRLTSSLLTDTALMRDHSDEEMTKTAKEYKRLIRNGGFIGIWLYIIAGVVRAAIVIGICIFLQAAMFFKPEEWSIEKTEVLVLEEVEQMMDASVGTTFAILTILTVINMFVMTRTTIVSEKLGDRAKGEHDANKKFIGVRLLLICSEVVPKAINVFVKGTPKLDLGEIQKILDRYKFMTEEQAVIMKNTILSFACLLAAIMNFIF